MGLLRREAILCSKDHSDVHVFMIFSRMKTKHNTLPETHLGTRSNYVFPISSAQTFF